MGKVKYRSTHIRSIKIRKRKITRTIAVLLMLVALELILIFYGHRLNSWLKMLLIMLIMSITMVIPMTWLKLKFDNGREKSISFAKVFVFLVPVAFLTIALLYKYKEHNIRNESAFTYGVVEKTYSYYSGRWTRQESYMADIKYKVNEEVITTQIEMKSLNQFKVGDKLKIEYSKSDPELSYIYGR